MMTPEQQRLLESARRGDKDAVDKLLSSFLSAIYRYGMKMCRDQEDAKDVAQETLLAAARSIGEFRGEAGISTWLYTIARRACLRHRRKGKHDPQELLSLDEIAGREPSGMQASARAPDEAAADSEVGKALARAIAALEEPYREVLVLRDVEGLTAPEVAEVLGITVEAVKSRLHRARLSVRGQILPLLASPSLPPVVAAVPQATSGRATAVRAARGQGAATNEVVALPDSPCTDVAFVFSRYLEGEIDADTCATMQAHLARCPGCRGACDSLKQTLSLCEQARGEAEVPAELVAAVRDALRTMVGARHEGAAR